MLRGYIIIFACVLCLFKQDTVQCFQNTLILLTLTPQTVILGILDSVSNSEKQWNLYKADISLKWIVYLGTDGFTMKKSL